MGINNLSLRAQVAWNATKHDGFVHWMHAPSRMSQIVHLCVKELEMRSFLRVTKTYQFPTLFGYFFNPGNWFHKYIIGHSSLRYPYSAKQMNPFSMHCLLKGTSFIRAEYTFLKNSGSKERRLGETSSHLPQGFLARLYIFDKAIGLQEYMGRHSNLYHTRA